MLKFISMDSMPMRIVGVVADIDGMHVMQMPTLTIEQIGTTEYTRPRRFRQRPDQWLRTIRLLWPECPAKISSDGLYLVINHAAAVLSREQSQHI